MAKLTGPLAACAHEGDGQPFAVARRAVHQFDAATGERRESA